MTVIDIPASWVPIVVAVIGAGVTILGLVVAWLTRLNHRMQRLEHRDRLSWVYIRSLIDHAYRHNAIPLPEPPEGWLEEAP